MRSAATLAFVLAAVFLSGCGNTGTNGVVQIGPDTYMIGRMGGAMDFSGSVVKAQLYKEGSQFCSDRSKVLVPVNSTAQDSAPAQYASAEIQFRCVAADAVRQ